MSRVSDIMEMDIFLNCGGPTHCCLRCGTEFTPHEDGCPECGVYGNVIPNKSEASKLRTDSGLNQGTVMAVVVVDIETGKDRILQPNFEMVKKGLKWRYNKEVGDIEYAQADGTYK